MVATNSVATSALILFPILFFFHPSLELPLFRRADRAVHSPVHAAISLITPLPIAAPTIAENLHQASTPSLRASSPSSSSLDPPTIRPEESGSSHESDTDVEANAQVDNDDVQSSLGHDRNARPSATGPSPLSGPWKLPKSPVHLFFEKYSPLGNTLAARNWMQPEILTSFARPFHEDESKFELAVFTTGVTMGSFQRNFNATHCLIGETAELYPVAWAEVDAFYCIVPRRVRKGEPVTVVLALDERLKEAFEGPVALRHGRVATLDKSRLDALPASAHVTDGGKLVGGPGNYRVVLTKHRMPIDTEMVPKSLKEYEERARYETCILAPVKMTSHLLKPWVDYHRRIGVDHVYILDNDDPTDVQGMFRDRPDVDVLYWPFQKSQSQHLTFALWWTRHHCRALHICDGDEYMMFGLGKNMELAGLRPYTGFTRRRAAEGYNLIFFPYLMMGHSGTLRMPTKDPGEVYVHVAAQKSKNVKSTMFLDNPWTISTLHVSRGWHRNRGHFKHNFTLYPEDPDDRPIEVHFWKRSYEEMVIKRNTGSADVTDQRNQAKLVELEKPDYDNPPEEYQNVDEALRYTYFRKLWREVTRVGSINLVNIVRETDKGRCVRVYNWEQKVYVGDEVCGKDLLNVPQVR